MKQGAQGSAAGVAWVPPQVRAADVERERRAGGDAVARGEHTHSEQPIPFPGSERPRAVVQRASVRGQILDALRTALVAGELRPGEVYSAPALGDRFGVSATPVREAMQQLALEGAVEVVPNRGFRVVERGARELAELAEVRSLIEVPVMLRLARTVPAERWAELRPLAEASVRAAASGCRATYAESDRAFHRAMLALSGNEQLVQIAEDLHRRAQWPLVGGPGSRGRAELVADAAEHTALLDALIARDVDVVRSLVGDGAVPGGVRPRSGGAVSPTVLCRTPAAAGGHPPARPLAAVRG
ncbi:GntR family transcriptional regulator [Streptomyces fulvoviolaceus]|uniref:GntR family transcriptional regulator n=1 Tax=Streptomyces fulvoviolaceus TaxID=285535 RepID=UPI000A8DD596